MEIARQVEKGVMSDKDREYYVNEIAQANKLQEQFRRLGNNEISPRLRRDSIQLLSRMITKAQNRVKEKRERYRTQLKNRQPDFPDDRLEGVFGEMPKLMNEVLMINPKTKEKLYVDISVVSDAMDGGFVVFKKGAK
jgi:hypothetical protein